MYFLFTRSWVPLGRQDLLSLDFGIGIKAGQVDCSIETRTTNELRFFLLLGTPSSNTSCYFWSNFHFIRSTPPSLPFFTSSSSFPASPATQASDLHIKQQHASPHQIRGPNQPHLQQDFIQTSTYHPNSRPPRLVFFKHH
jgi:hypothetical protein